MGLKWRAIIGVRPEPSQAVSKLLLSTALMLSLAACSAGQGIACGIDANALAGDWQRSGDTGAFEQFSLGMDGDHRRFDSWLHERPEITAGAWTFQTSDCQLAVSGPDPGLQWQFRVALDAAGTQLTLTPLDIVGSTADELYRRLPD